MGASHLSKFDLRLNLVLRPTTRLLSSSLAPPLAHGPCTSCLFQNPPLPYSASRHRATFRHCFHVCCSSIRLALFCTLPFLPLHHQKTYWLFLPLPQTNLHRCLCLSLMSSPGRTLALQVHSDQHHRASLAAFRCSPQRRLLHWGDRRP